jgi:hydrogenase maturation protease
MSPGRILVACVGNIFLGDDAFGVEVARRLSRVGLPEAVEVRDFGIRGLDLVYAMMDGYEAVILVDAAPRGGPPGTLYVIELEVVGPTSAAPGAGVSLDMHALDPARVIGLVASLGGHVGRLLLVGCEPSIVVGPEDVADGLSEPVQAAVEAAILLIGSLVARVLAGEEIGTAVFGNFPWKEVESCRECPPNTAAPGSPRSASGASTRASRSGRSGEVLPRDF